MAALCSRDPDRRALSCRPLRAWQVTVDLNGAQRATEAELADPEYMSPSAMVDNSDEVIIELAHKIDPMFARYGYKLGGKGETIEGRLLMDVRRQRRRQPHARRCL